jgi:outer membrane immunogenic protein
MKKLLAGSIAVAALMIGSSGWAADMPRKAPPGAPTAAPAAPEVSWTGCYIGANIGAGSASKDWTNPSLFPDEPGDHGQADFGGFIGGGQIGCDYHFANTWLTIGIQGMFDGASLSGDVLDTQDEDQDFDLTTRVHWFGTVTGRVGFTVQPNWLLYVKGGAAWVRDHHVTVESGVPFTDFADITRAGWTVGAGAEWMFFPNWSLFVEYDFMDFGTRTIPFTLVGGGFNETWDIKQNVQVIMAGLNFRFNWGKGKTPVVAKY